MTSASATRRSATYFVHPLFDGAFAGGLSLCALAGVFLWMPSGPSTAASHWAGMLMWVVNWPHFSATLHRLFHRRENIAQYPATAYGITALVVIGIAASIASPSLLAPYFVKLFLIWSPYHFSGQTLGITLLYARRSGVEFDGWPRRALSAFIFGTYFFSTLRAETTASGSGYYGITYPGLNVPQGMPQLAQVVMYAAAAALVVFVALESRKRRRVFPWIVALPAITQYAWFVGGSSLQPFYIFVPLFHSMQYLPIAWAMHLGSVAPGRAWQETARWGAVNLAGGVALFWLLPHALAKAGVPLDFAMGVAIAGVQIHHFFVDGVIWKLRRSSVASPLLANARDYFRVPQSVKPTRAAA